MTPDQLRSGLRFVRLFLEEYEDEIVAIAAGRFAEGVFLYPDKPLFRKTRPELAVDIAQELADAAVYARRHLDIKE